MKIINLRELHKILLSRFDLGPMATELIGKIMAGSEKATDYEEILKKDKFFTTMICQIASVNMKESVVSSIAHGVVIAGQQGVRDAVLGHTIQRIFSPHADNEFVNMETSAKKLKYTLKAEEHAKKCKNEYTGLALASGFIFDVMAAWINKEPKLVDTFEPFLESVWKHGIRTASLAWALATHPRVFISHRKIIYASGLLHDIGKLGLALYKPEEYGSCLEKMKGQRDGNPGSDSFEVAIEKDHFDLTHPEIGSAIIFQTKFLREMEMEIDFHHDILLLKTRSPDAFLGSAVVGIADSLACLMEHRPNFAMEELQEIMRPHAAYFPLKAHDVMNLYADVRGKGLLNA